MNIYANVEKKLYLIGERKYIPNAKCMASSAQHDPKTSGGI